MHSQHMFYSSTDIEYPSCLKNAPVVCNGGKQPLISSNEPSYQSINNTTENTENKSQPPSFLHTKYFGMFIAFVSGIFFTLWTVVLKYLTDIDVVELLLFRAVIQLVVSGAILLYKRQWFLGPEKPCVTVIINAVVGGGVLMILICLSIRRLPVGDANTLIFSSPVIVMIISVFLFRERCGLLRTIVAILLLLGVCILSKPPFLFHPGESVVDWLGYGVALSASLFTAITVVVIRKCEGAPDSVIVFTMGFGSLVASILYIFTVGEPSLPKTCLQWALSSLQGLIGALGLMMVTRSLALTTPSKVSVLRSFEIVLAYILQVLVFGDIPYVTDIIGAVLVVLSVIGIALEDNILEACSSYQWL